MAEGPPWRAPTQWVVATLVGTALAAAGQAEMPAGRGTELGVEPTDRLGDAGPPVLGGPPGGLPAEPATKVRVAQDRGDPVG